MKRLIAKLLSFLLMIIMIVSVVCRSSENFPAVLKITGVTSQCTEDNTWELSKNDRTLIQVPYIGKIMESIAEPKGFVVCLAVFFVLLFMGRKKNTKQREKASALYEYSDYYDYDCESLAEVSEAEAVSEGDTASASGISLSEM